MNEYFTAKDPWVRAAKCEDIALFEVGQMFELPNLNPSILDKAHDAPILRWQVISINRSDGTIGLGPPDKGATID